MGKRMDDALLDALGTPAGRQRSRVRRAMTGRLAVLLAAWRDSERAELERLYEGSST